MELARHHDADFTFGRYAHTRLEVLSKCSSGPNGTFGGPVKHGPKASQVDPSRHTLELPGQDSNLEKQDQNLL